MKSKPTQGQILIMVVGILFFVLVLTGINFGRWWEGVQKIRHQRETDLLNLRAAVEIARTYNAIAALNQGLSIAVERGQAITLALYTLRICALATLGASPCSEALISLELDSQIFFKKLAQLGRVLGLYQDQILEWGNQAPGNLIEFENKKHLNRQLAFIYPNFSGSFSINSSNDLLPVERSAPVNSNFLFSVPPPYLFKPSFFSQGNRLILLYGFSSTANPFQIFLLSETHSTLRDSWNLSEAEILGKDLFRMEFEANLRQISLQQELWRSLSSKRVTLSSQGFQLPLLKDFENDLAH